MASESIAPYYGKEAVLFFQCRPHSSDGNTRNKTGEQSIYSYNYVCGACCWVSM